MNTNPTVVVSLFRASRPDTSLDDLPPAEKALSDTMAQHYDQKDAISVHYQQTIIDQGKKCHAWRYAPTKLSWNLQSQVEECTKDLFTNFKALEDFDEGFNYGIGNGHMFLPHLADPKPKRDKIERQLVEWLSELDGDKLPTFQEALKQTGASGSAHQGLAMTLDHVRGFRLLNLEEQETYVAKWGRGNADEDGNEDGEVEGVSI